MVLCQFLLTIPIIKKIIWSQTTLIMVRSLPNKISNLFFIPSGGDAGEGVGQETCVVENQNTTNSYKMVEFLLNVHAFPVP